MQSGNSTNCAKWHTDCKEFLVVAIVASAESLQLRFDSDITFVDYAVDIIDDLLSYHGIRDRTNLLIVCRELLKNAVVHGNRNDVGKAVTFRVERVGGGSYRVEAEDGGSGCQQAALKAGVGESCSEQRRGGFALIRAVAQRVDVDGNRVTALVDL